MKKHALIIMMSLVMTGAATAQDKDKPEHPTSISLNIGNSLVGDFVKSNIADGAKAKVTPAFQLNVDHRLTRVISLGLAASYQKIGAEVSNHSFEDPNNPGNTITENYDMAFTRINIGLRPLFHYGNMDRIDMYSGLRIGYTMWSYDTDSKDPANQSDDDFKDRFAPQFILFGMKAYVTEHIGLNGEFAIGAPHYLSFGATYRF